MDNQTIVNEMIVKAREALARLENYSQEQIDELCRVCCEAFAAHAEELAEEAVAETGLGNIPRKIPDPPTACGTPSRGKSLWVSLVTMLAAI